MVESLGGPPGGQDILVLLFTTANCLGRLGCGWASEVLLHSYGTPRQAAPPVHLAEGLTCLRMAWPRRACRPWLNLQYVTVQYDVAQSSAMWLVAQKMAVSSVRMSHGACS